MKNILLANYGQSNKELNQVVNITVKINKDRTETVVTDDYQLR